MCDRERVLVILDRLVERVEWEHLALVCMCDLLVERVRHACVQSVTFHSLHGSFTRYATQAKFHAATRASRTIVVHSKDPA